VSLVARRRASASSHIVFRQYAANFAVQFYDLSQRHPFEVTAFRSEITPIIWGVNARFTRQPMADYLFEAAVGDGRILACCLRVGGADNVAGRYLTRALIRYAAGEQFRPAAGKGSGLTNLLQADAD
jgi:hypothetical protein